jgi:molybdopterin converting factor small subunit
MQVKVRFFGNFQKLFGMEEKMVDLKEGATVGELVRGLCGSQQCFSAIFDQSGKPRHDAYIMCKCKKVRLVDEEKTKLEDGDVIILYPLLSTRAAQNVP